MPELNHTPRDTAFEIAGSRVRYGPGVTREIGMDLADMAARRVMVVTDPKMATMQPLATLRQALENEAVDYAVFDRVHIEPTDHSFREAIEFAQDGEFDAFLAIGGGSTIDTAKIADLCATYPADFSAYVNPPLGEGRPVPGPLRPLIAIPTTAGTGSETTGVAVFDYLEKQVKTGIAHPRLRPDLAVLDPDHTATLPPLVAASTGLDVLSHAIESYTAIAHDQRPRPDRPSKRGNYQGRNPISDVWAIQSLRMVCEHLRRVYRDPTDEESRGMMLLAATYAGIGFGNAGVHLPHAMSYPVAGLVRDYHPPGYDTTEPIAPHGIAVIVNAPAAFRYTAQAAPQRHLDAAAVLGADTAQADPADAGKILSDRIIALMHELDLPNGLNALGFTETDLTPLTTGTLAQQRLTNMSPRPVDQDAMTTIFRDALAYW